MEIKLPLAGLSQSHASQDVFPELLRSQQIVPGQARNTEAASEPEIQDRETVRDLLGKTAELLSSLDRKLKFEVLEDIGLVQIQVIDADDGRVVRKIPSDEVIKLVKHIKDQLSDRVDVIA